MLSLSISVNDYKISKIVVQIIEFSKHVFSFPFNILYRALLISYHFGQSAFAVYLQGWFSSYFKELVVIFVGVFEAVWLCSSLTWTIPRLCLETLRTCLIII